MLDLKCVQNLLLTWPPNSTVTHTSLLNKYIGLLPCHFFEETHKINHRLREKMESISFVLVVGFFRRILPSPGLPFYRL